MADLGNKVLSEKDKKKVEMSKNVKGAKKDKNDKDESEGEPLGKYFSIEDRMKMLRDSFNRIINGNKKNIVKNLKSFVEDANTVVDELDSYGYSEEANKLTSISNKVEKVYDQVKEKKITTVSDVVERVEKLQDKMDKIELKNKEEKEKAKDESYFSEISGLETVSLSDKGEGSPIFIVSAPVVFTLEGYPKAGAVKTLKEEFGLGRTGRFYYFKEAPLVVGRKAKLDEEQSFQDQLDKFLELVNKKSGEKLKAIHSIGKDTDRFIVSLIIDSKIDSSFQNLLEKVVETSIMVK